MVYDIELPTIMEVGDIVHVKGRGVGTIDKISTQLEGGRMYPQVIAKVVLVGGGDQVFIENDLKMKNGEWWEK